MDFQSMDILEVKLSSDFKESYSPWSPFQALLLSLHSPPPLYEGWARVAR